MAGLCKDFSVYLSAVKYGMAAVRGLISGTGDPQIPGAIVVQAPADPQ
jgi:hypothetical protein